MLEAKTGNEGRGYHGEWPSKDAAKKFAAAHRRIKKLMKADDSVVTHYLDSTHGRHLADTEKDSKDDDEYVSKDFNKFLKRYNPEHFA